MLESHTLPYAPQTGISLFRRVPSALFGAPLRFLRTACQRRREGRLHREFEAARYALGERMYRAGIDDGETIAQIAALDQQIFAARYADRPHAMLEARRIALVLRLADAALENDAPLPGADDEFARAWHLKTSCEAVGQTW